MHTPHQAERSGDMTLNSIEKYRQNIFVLHITLSLKMLKINLC